MFKFATLMPRVAANIRQPNYLSEVEEICDLSDIRDEILQRVSAVIEQVS